jgi:tetratricopeptide (TPR) repeat protein
VQLGDQLFGRGQYQEAFAQFQIAASVNPGEPLIQARLDQCRPRLPAPAPPVQSQPGLAVLDFITIGDPRIVPTGLGGRVAARLGPYFTPHFRVVDRGALAWYMGRLGLTIRDVVTDPVGRAYLGMATDARYFIVGTVRPTPAGVEVVAHLLDATTGGRVDKAAFIARDVAELQYRIPEIARWMMTDPNVRIAELQQADAYQQLLLQAEMLTSRGDYLRAMDTYRECLSLRPDDVRARALIVHAERQARLADIDNRRRSDRDRHKTAFETGRVQEQQLLREAEKARRQAEQAAAVAQADRQRQQREAFDRLVGQARAAREQQHLSRASELFAAALALNASPEVAREHAAVKTRVGELARLKQAEDRAARESELREQREKELARLREQAEQDRIRREAQEQARRQRQDEKDRREYTRLFDSAKGLASNRRYDEALDLAHQAKRIRSTPDVERFISETVSERKKAGAASVTSPPAGEKKPSTPQAVIAPTSLPKSPPPPAPSTKPSTDKVAPPPLPKAEPTSPPATPPPLPKTPPPLPGKSAEKAPSPPPLPKAKPTSPPVTPPPLPKTEKPVDQTPSKSSGPANPKAELPPLPSKAKSNPAQKKAAETEKSKDREKPTPPAEFTRKVRDGAASERQGRYAEAATAYEEALKLVPGDPDVKTRLEYARQMDRGGKALLARKFSDAVAAYEAALRAAPGDQAAQRQLQRARAAK